MNEGLWIAWVLVHHQPKYLRMWPTYKSRKYGCGMIISGMVSSKSLGRYTLYISWRTGPQWSSSRPSYNIKYYFHYLHITTHYLHITDSDSSDRTHIGYRLAGQAKAVIYKHKYVAKLLSFFSGRLEHTCNKYSPVLYLQIEYKLVLICIISTDRV